jgi:phosphohistidine swiveling domain-containing protein
MNESVAKAPRCLPLESAGGAEAGGKAQGLARLIGLGLRVPPGFVVLDAAPGSLPDTLPAHYEQLGGGVVAVRSSAQGEDSQEASFAGQYRTLLDVEGPEELRKAIEECLSSLHDARAVTYRQEQTRLTHVSMCVVVQRMVDAAAAGVLFTADPVSGRRNCLIVDAVPGTGEKLVSGRVTPDHYTLSRGGEVLGARPRSETPLLRPEHLRELAAGAMRAERDYGKPLDLEWALGRDGCIYWLQARPITRLAGDPNELDVMQDAEDIYTSCNIGECMPGAITPLTFATVWHADDRALQIMHVRCGAARRIVDGYLHSRLYYGRMLLNLTKLGRMATHVVGSTSERMTLALCGRIIPELDPGPKASALLRVFNGLRFVTYLLSGQKHRRRLEKLVKELRFPDAQTSGRLYEAIASRLSALYLAFDHHMVSSAGSGALEPTLMEILAKRGEVTEGHYARLAMLLAGASDQATESADIVNGIHRIVDRLLEQANAEAGFMAASPPAALAWIRSQAGGAAGQEFAAYLQRHGHRCIRELELRQKEWSADPLPLVASIQASCRARLLRNAGAAALDSLEASRAFFRSQRPLMRALVGVTQKAVQRRESTKSLLVAVVARFKGAYRRLGELLAAEGKLPDADAVFFLTHKELGLLVGEAGDGLVEKALRRREVLGYQMELRFPDVFSGSPEPLADSLEPVSYDHTLRGKPVSRGQARGYARVVTSLQEADTIRPGEILIAPVTDVGWSPYFSLVAGLATDVGSSVSHGAVVAREYGLPAVVDLRQATKMFKTGDRVLLDGDHGLLRLDEREVV